jgi:hypothetical protein
MPLHQSLHLMACGGSCAVALAGGEAPAPLLAGARALAGRTRRPRSTVRRGQGNMLRRT